jgi:arylsulfatase A-like enzyme
MENLGTHSPAGPLRGGKNSKYEGGTRVPFIVTWQKGIEPGVSDALFSQVDLIASFAALTGQSIPVGEAPDSFNSLDTLLGKSHKDRDFLIQHGNGLAIVADGWKYTPPSTGPTHLQNPRLGNNAQIETGNQRVAQLYNIRNDIGEKNNVADKHPEIVKKLAELLETVQKKQ